MIPRLRPQIGFQEFSEAIFGNGGIQDFESSFAKLVDQKYAIAFF